MKRSAESGARSTAMKMLIEMRPEMSGYGARLRTRLRGRSEGIVNALC
jgi:hypothetical protein